MAILSARLRGAAAFLVAGLLPAYAAADLVQTVDTTSLAYGVYPTLGGPAGPYPFSNFGVQANVNLGTDLAASVQGATQFSFPVITSGTTFRANSSTIALGYTPSWTGGSIGSHTGLSVDTSFVYNLGPFKGMVPIYSSNANASSSGSIGGGSTLVGGTANGVGSGNSDHFTYTLSSGFLGATVASASVGVQIGLDLQNTIQFTPTVQYGYYTWVNSTGTLSSADTLTWHGVSSGDLDYSIPSDLSTQAGSNTLFLNFLPGVQMQMPIVTTATVTVPLTGTFSAEAFGATLANLDLSLGNLYSYTANYDTWNDDVDWNGQDYYSLKLQEDNTNCQRLPSSTCELYKVLGDPLLVDQNTLSSNTTQNFMGSVFGGWDQSVQNAPLLPEACDQATGNCYASDDPDMPIGTGTVTYQVSSVPVPEPASWALLLAGLGSMGHALRRSQGERSVGRAPFAFARPGRCELDRCRIN